MGMGDGRGGSGSGSGAAAMSEEERALAEAIRLSMLDAEGGGGSGEAGEAGEGGEVDDLAARLDGQTLGDDEEEQYELDDDGVLPRCDRRRRRRRRRRRPRRRGEGGGESGRGEGRRCCRATYRRVGRRSASGAGRSEPAKGTPGRHALRPPRDRRPALLANEDPVVAIYAVAVEQVGEHG